MNQLLRDGAAAVACGEDAQAAMDRGESVRRKTWEATFHAGGIRKARGGYAYVATAQRYVPSVEARDADDWEILSKNAGVDRPRKKKYQQGRDAKSAPAAAIVACIRVAQSVALEAHSVSIMSEVERQAFYPRLKGLDETMETAVLEATGRRYLVPAGDYLAR